MVIYTIASYLIKYITGLLQKMIKLKQILQEFRDILLLFIPLERYRNWNNLNLKFLTVTDGREISSRTNVVIFNLRNGSSRDYRWLILLLGLE